MTARFPADMIDTRALGNFGFSIKTVDASGDVIALRDDMIKGRLVTAQNEMFSRLLRSCLKLGGTDNSGMSEG